MEIQTAGENVGARETLERKVGAVGAAADGLDARLDARHLHGLYRLLNYVIMRLYLGAHVVVLVLDLNRHRTLAVLAVEEIGDAPDLGLPRLIQSHIVVANDIGRRGLLHAALHSNQVEESLIPFRVLRLLLNGKQRIKLLHDAQGVLHLALRITGMHVAALHAYLGGSGIEILKLKLAHVAAVHRVGIIGAELLHVELHYAASNLLVGSEPYLNLTMPELRVLNDILHGVHNLGNAGLVVGAKQRRAVGRDQSFTLMSQHLGELRGAQTKPRHTPERDVAAVVIRYYLGLYILARSVGRRVHMSNKTKLGSFDAGRGGNRGHHIAVIV